MRKGISFSRHDWKINVNIDIGLERHCLILDLDLGPNNISTKTRKVCENSLSSLLSLPGLSHAQRIRSYFQFYF